MLGVDKCVSAQELLWRVLTVTSLKYISKKCELAYIQFKRHVHLTGNIDTRVFRQIAVPS